MSTRPQTAIAVAVDLVHRFEQFSAHWRSQIAEGGPIGSNRLYEAYAEVWAAAAVAARAYDFGPLVPVVGGPCVTCGDPIGYLDVEHHHEPDAQFQARVQEHAEVCHELAVQALHDAGYNEPTGAADPRERRQPPMRYIGSSTIARPCGHAWSGILPDRPRTTAAGTRPAAAQPSTGDTP